ncbi:SLIT-ROBO Rho GTPase-activating protein 1 isoform X1 [Patella vulgata]|uniref:SLIT-ROBO Rho GTPase-activating protein 1 isoform X1 n=1 Tax=Patella vulgata TaxID=6465 RepID=UPI00217F6104|nr:SLIT-ROBO Rho GTPase-activating protein 1 isoform X1 [Patella vulgata]
MSSTRPSELSLPYLSRSSSLRRSTKKKSSFSSNIRQQLCDQLKGLEVKLEVQVAIVAELQEFFKRRAEVEIEYSKNLDKLVRQMITRHRAEKSKQEQWATFSTYACWKHLLGITRKQSQDHQKIGEIYSNQVVNRLNEVMENSQRIFKKCRDIGAESHQDMLKALNELQSAMKTYHAYQSEAKQAEQKLRNVESQKNKVEQQLSGKNTTSRKLKGLERQSDKRQVKYSENKLKALKARNEYLLSIEAANAAISKYFSDDISDLMDCMDFGYHNSCGRTMMMYLSVHEHLKQTHISAIDSLNKCISDLDSRADKQKFMELNNSVFMLPKKFEFQPFKGDEVRQISAQKPVQEDLVQRYQGICDRLNCLKVENDEIWKTLETTEKALVETTQEKDYDVSKYFIDDNTPVKSPQENAKQKASMLETESYYLSKFREYTLSCNRLSRLQSKQSAIQKSLGDNILSPYEKSNSNSRPPSLPPKPVKRRIGRTPNVGQPKLFGGSLEEFVEASGQEIPLIIKSCIRIINLYGLHHQGIFRVSGSIVEINGFKASFESGDDPLVDTIDASDINSVAGVLKLYFRELREPLFPLHLFDELVSCSREEDMVARVERIKYLLSGLPRSVIVVMRYLFAHLNHISEYSDESMMDPYNLAICFGPTLLPIPPDRDQVSYQSSVNEIIKTIIIHQEEIFPNDGGTIYEKCIVESKDKGNDTCDDDEDDETSSTPSDEDEPDILEATALYDFEGRTERELSFKKGDILVIYQQVSTDWWEGAFGGKEGLIPDKYVTWKTAGSEEQKSFSSEEDRSNSSHSLPSKPVRQSSEDGSIGKLEKTTLPTTITEVRETDIIDTMTPSPPPTPRSSIGSKVTSSSSLVPSSPSPETPEIKRILSSSSTTDTSADDLSMDIDNALAEVMDGLKSLEMQQISDKRMSLPIVKTKQTPKHTPDLVLDLPEGSNSPTSQDSSSGPDSPNNSSAAENFAKCNQGTLKKASSMPRNINPEEVMRESSPPTLPKVPIFSSSSAIKRSPNVLPGMRAKSLNSSEESPPMVPTIKTSPMPPPVAEKPKIKFKPTVMKKPNRSPETQRKFPEITAQEPMPKP